MTSATEHTCKECGNAIPSASPGGFCGRCLLAFGLLPGAQSSGITSGNHENHRATPQDLSSGTDSTCGDPADTAALPAPLAEKTGDRIGRYRLLQEIGHGGCGVVYMAEQEEPVRRKVALKVIKLGMDTRQVVARFEAERQTLALMDHPNIARVLDAGATDTGRPFFVMELVGGIKITDYCDQYQLTTHQRLDLFIQVCRAVQHAHQKGVIHRDLKPSNILVTTQDGVAVPKVIDFGIAKATQGRLTDQTLFTAFEQFLGTPAYMSPEQAQLGGLDIDTRSDIYSLGVLLYELLTDKTPFDTRELVASGLDGMRRTILEKEPSRPSNRLSTMTEAELTAAARHRQSDAPKLLHLVRGDLDWIVMKCLEKDRARRYETANALAADIECHLNQEPVTARPPSTLYRAHKFIRRNRVIAAGVTAIVTVLVLGVVMSARETVRARRAEFEQRRLVFEAQAARREATEKLWASYLAEARALRLSGQEGRVFESFSALQKAAIIRPSLALRNEAIASMVLTDIRWLARKDFLKTRQSVSLDPTSERYAVCEPTGEVSLRRWADDAEEARLKQTNAVATAVGEFGPDGKFLAVSYADGHWRVWDLLEHSVALEVPVFRGSAFAPDGQILGISDATNIVLHDLAGRKQLNSITLNGFGSPQAPGWFRFDPKGRRLALYSTEAWTNAVILEARTGRTLKTLEHDDLVLSVAWHPGGQYLATGCSDKTIHIWNATSGERLRRWRTESSVSVGFNRTGSFLVSSGWDGFTRIWNYENGQQLFAIHRSGFILGFSADDLQLAIRNWLGTTVDLFELAWGQGLHDLYEATEAVSGGGGSAAIDPGERLVAFRSQEGIGLWDLRSERKIGFLPAKDKCLVGFDAAGESLILTGREGLLRCPIRRAADGEPCVVGEPFLVNPECADPAFGRMGWISANRQICAVIGNQRCQIFRMDTFQKQAETGRQPGMRFAAVHPDGSLIATGAFQRPGVKVWDARTGGLVKELPGEENNPETATTVAFTPDGHNLVIASREEYCFWEVGSWSLVRRIPQVSGNDFPAMMAFSGDGRIFAGTHSRSKVRLYEAATGRVLADLEAPNSRMITGLAFNHDGKQLAVAESADALRLWDLKQIRTQLAELGLGWD